MISLDVVQPALSPSSAAWVEEAPDGCQREEHPPGGGGRKWSSVAELLLLLLPGE